MATKLLCDIKHIFIQLTAISFEIKSLESQGVIMNGNSLCNKDVSNRVPQADEKVGIVVYTSSIDHLCCVLLPGSTNPLGESGVTDDLRLPFSAARRSAMQAFKYYGSMSERSE